MSENQTEILDPNKAENLIVPFKSQTIKKPTTIGSRIVQDEWTGKLDNMGFENITDEPEKLEERLKWDIAHRHYDLLVPCVSVTAEYDKQKQGLAYLIDLYGDNKVTKQGDLFVTLSDYIYFYLRMSKRKRRESLVTRISLANVGMLVPYVELGVITLGADGLTVRVPFEIKI